MGFASHRDFVERARKGPARATIRFDVESSGAAQRFLRLAWSQARQLWVGIGEQLAGVGYLAWSRGLGDAWTQVVVGIPAQDLRGISTVGSAGTGTAFALVGTGGPGVALTSVDGKVYVQRVVPVGAPNLNAIAEDGNGHVVAVGDAMAGAGSWVMESLDDGITWNRIANPNPGGDHALRAALWSGAQWVLGGDNGKLITSPDRIVWTDRSVAGFAVQWLAHDGAGTVVAFGPGALVSRDYGITWTGPFALPSGGGGGNLRGGFWSGRQWVAVQFSTGPISNIYTSRNAERWARMRSVPGYALLTIARGQLDGREILIGGGNFNVNNIVYRTGALL